MLKKIYKAVIVPYTVFILYLLFLGMGRFQYEDNLITVESVFSTVKFVQNNIDRKYTFRIILGNVIMFIPFGFSGWVFPKLKDLRSLIYAFISAMFIVEGLQYFTRMGIFEIDDIILNTFGAYLGWLLCGFADKRFNY
jgi:glycopeptide antibiotics resistance protein